MLKIFRELLLVSNLRLLVERAVAKVIVLSTYYLPLIELSLLTFHLQEVIVQVQPGDTGSFLCLRSFRLTLFIVRGKIDAQ